MPAENSLSDVARAAAGSAPDTVSKGAHDAVVAQAATEATTRARAAERERSKAILASEHAKGREKLAAHLAHETDLPADQAVAILQNAETASPSTGSRLDAAMTDPKVAPEASGKTLGDLTKGLDAAVDQMVAGMTPKG